MSVTSEQDDRIEAENRRIRAEIDALPAYEDAQFWPTVDAQGEAISPEVLVHIYRVFRQRDRAADTARATDHLIIRAYGMAEKIIGRRLKSHPDDQGDAVHDAFKTMWRHVNSGDPFWERNFRGAMTAACNSACRAYYRPMNSATPLSAAIASPGGADYDALSRDPRADLALESVLTDVTYEQTLASLDEDTRAVVRLVYEEDLRRNEIATRLGCDPKTVYNRLNKAADAFADAFDRGVRE